MSFFVIKCPGCHDFGTQESRNDSLVGKQLKCRRCGKSALIHSETKGKLLSYYGPYNAVMATHVAQQLQAQVGLKKGDILADAKHI